MCVVSWKEFPVLLGIFTQSEDSREYAGFFPSVKDVHQVDEVDVRVSHSLKCPPGFSVDLDSQLLSSYLLTRI